MSDVNPGQAVFQTAILPSSRLSLSRAWYGVFILVLAYTASFIDRTILSLLVQPIQQDLGLNDTEVSLLHGLAFAIFYTFLGLPIARMADHMSRRRIIIVGITIWSLMTATCGLASRFWHLFLSRVGVGVGEAALSPAAYSMIADMFPKEQHGRALGVYSTGLYIGSGLAFIIGGTVIDMVARLNISELPFIGAVQNWQIIFFLVGLPGIAIVLLMMTVKEPPRIGQMGTATAVPFRAVLRFWGSNWKSFSCHFIGFSMTGLVFNGLLAWAPVLFMRKFGYQASEVGHALGISILIFGTCGIIAGGVLADWWVKHGRAEGPMRAGWVGALAVTPLAVLAPLAGSDQMAIAFFCLFFFFASFPYGAAIAALQAITPNPMRAQISAFFLFVLNMMGIGLGPTIVAVFTDYVFADPMAIDRSMAVVGAIFGPLGAIALYLGFKPFAASAQRANIVS
ncbi:spinster family MFS transporter [Govanella unica]|uniref:MFS transporter n=1 Tax=Govanella unica TaxID=2975056 RepID=A0A9X3TZ65_9PROT|nr:MFS transporter [Govania unica]MDA5194425.1 MFS transporter [Govania unica]